MRILSLLFALVVGLVNWALVLVFSDGVAPLGKMGQAEGWVFFAPIAIFALSAAKAVRAAPTGHAMECEVTDRWATSGCNARHA